MAVSRSTTAAASAAATTPTVTGPACPTVHGGGCSASASATTAAAHGPSPVTTTTGVSASRPHRRSAVLTSTAVPPPRAAASASSASGRRSASSRSSATSDISSSSTATSGDRSSTRSQATARGTSTRHGEDRTGPAGRPTGNVGPGNPPAVALGQGSRRASHQPPGRREHPAPQAEVGRDQVEDLGQHDRRAVPGGHGRDRRDQAALAAQHPDQPVAARQLAGHPVGDRGEGVRHRHAQQRQAGRGAHLDQVLRDVAELGLAGRQRRHAGADQRGDEPVAAPRLVRPPPGEPGEDQLPAGQVAPRVEQVGGDDRPDRRIAGQHTDRDQRAARPIHQFPQVHAHSRR